MKIPETLDVNFDLHVPGHISEDEVTIMLKDIMAFVEENFSTLDDERTLDMFLNHCNERKYYMPLVHEATKQVFEAIYGKEMLAEMAIKGRAKKPTIN